MDEDNSIIEYISMPDNGELVRVNAEIVQVTDGDTVIVEIKKQINIRLLHYCDEIGSGDSEIKARGLLQKNYLADLLSKGKDIKLEFQLSGKNLSHMFTFGRLLGTIKVDGVDISDKMIADGMAYAANNKVKKENK